VRATTSGLFKMGKQMMSDNKEFQEPGMPQLNEQEIQSITSQSPPILEREEEDIFRQGLRVLNNTGVTYAVGAAFARYIYTGIWRSTKDLDVFLKPQDLKLVMDEFKEAGFETHVESPHWLAKAKKNGHTIDLIFGTGHGLLPIDDSSFAGSQQAKIVGVNTRLFPIEEMIAAASFINVRGRFDGAEVLHLIQGSRGELDWERILRRLGDNRQLLLWHLILFDFVYPGHKDYLPRELMVELFDEVRQNWESSRYSPKAFRGTVIDPFSFRVDIDDWGYEDQRNMQPLVNDAGELL
jgi:hypothetical protein